MAKFEEAMMKLVKWLKKPINQKISSFKNRYYYFENGFFEKRYKLDFYGDVNKKDLVASSRFSLENACDYHPYGNPEFKDLIDEALSVGGSFDRFVDIGCGKGKQCIYAAKYYSFKEIIGIEFSRPLVSTAEANFRKVFPGRLRVLHEDATNWRIPDGRGVIFLFNPFNEFVMEVFIRENIDHFKKFNSVVAYANDLHRDVLERHGFQVVYRSQKKRNSILVINS